MTPRHRLLMLLALLPFAASACTGYATHLSTWEKAERSTTPTATQPRAIPQTTSVPPAAARPPALPPPMAAETIAPLSLPDPAISKTLAPASNDTEFTAKQLGDGFTLPQLEALVLLRSPELRAAEADYQGVLERYSQSAAVNDLLGRYAAFTRALETGVGDMAPGSNNAGLYPFPGSVALRGEIVQQEVAAAREARELVRRNLLANTRRAYWELLYTRQAHANAIHEFDVVDSLKNTSAIGYAAGNGPFADLVQVDIEHGLMKAAIPIQLEALQVKGTAIRALLDLPSTVVLGTPADTEPVRQMPLLAETTATALAARQELRILRFQIAKTELLIALAESESHPGYAFNLAAFPAQDGKRVMPGGERAESFATTTAAGVGAGTPNNAFFGLAEGYLRETRQALAALRHRLQNEEAQTRSTVQEAWYQLNKAMVEERLYREKIVPLAQVGIETANLAFAANQASHAQLLATYSKWFSAILGEQRNLTSLGAAWATLEERVGARVPLSPAGNGNNNGQ